MSSPVHHNKSKWSKNGSSGYKKQLAVVPPPSMAATSSDDDDYNDEGKGLMVHDDLLDEQVQQLVQSKKLDQEPVGFFDRLAHNVTEVYNSTLGAELYGSAPVLAPGSKPKKSKKDGSAKKDMMAPTSPNQRHGGGTSSTSPNSKQKKLVLDHGAAATAAAPSSPGKNHNNKKKKTNVTRSRTSCSTTG